MATKKGGKTEERLRTNNGMFQPNSSILSYRKF
jgi:hypothetical protein